MIEVYFKSKIVKNWILSIEADLDKIVEFNYHLTLESLKNELDIKLKSTIAIVDLTDSNFSLYTKNYFGNAKNIKFIGIGIKLEISDLKTIVDSNVDSFVEVGNSSIELIKAIKTAPLTFNLPIVSVERVQVCAICTVLFVFLHACL